MRWCSKSTARRATAYRATSHKEEIELKGLLLKTQHLDTLSPACTPFGVTRPILAVNLAHLRDRQSVNGLVVCPRTHRNPNRVWAPGSGGASGATGHGL